MQTSNKAPLLFYRLIHSFSLKLFLLALILLSVPLILYWQFQAAEREQLGLLRNAADQTGRIIAAMLRPRFEQFRTRSPSDLREALAGAAIGNTNVKVLVRLAGTGADDFIYVASYPGLSAGYLKEERHKLIRSGILGRLAPTCDQTTDLELRFVNPAGRQELLTSMTPVHVGANCWIVITSQNVSELAPMPLDLPFWKTPTMKIAAAIYVVSTALVVWLFAHMWRNVSRFRTAARRISMRGAGGGSFRELNSIPELTRVAEDFDSLVDALTASQNLIKQTAEDNIHALKAPLAVIAQSIEPLKRIMPSLDASAQRSLMLIEHSAAKLDNLLSSARDIEQAVAEVVYPARRPMNFSAFLGQMLADYDATMAAQGKHLSVRIPKNVTAYTNEDLMEPVVENLLENAASFTPKGGTIEVSLHQDGNFAHMCIADRGPGIDPDKLLRIFNRYVSYRPAEEGDDLSAAECHQGLGLWIVKRNVEGLGGKIEARNREGGGFEVVVRLKAKA